jgi:serine/threonine-protein kinase
MKLAQGLTIDDRYELVGRLGSGGMADVWLANDRQLGRQVALKFLHERFAQDAQFVERFRREASAAAGLQHPNVVGVFDRGEWEGGRYIAMEYVEGASLKDLIARGLSIPEAVEIVRQILAGARFAHERGIVHRDLKPQNVLVDAEGRARVTDFGIARAGASEITQEGSVLGTAQYLSPEQAQGLDVEAPSDLYSIGVILYEGLTGKLPFDGDTPVKIALKQISEQAQPPSRANPQVTPALDAVVLRALAKDPANRFASAEEFLQALDAAEADPSGAGLGNTAAYAAAALGGAAAAGALTPEEAAAQEAQEEEQRSGWMTRRRAAIIAAILLLLGAVAAYALTRSKEIAVPAVLEMSQAEAETTLEAAGFEVSPQLRPSCTPDGTVFEQDPGAGVKAEEGAEVTIFVSSGTAVQIPTVTDLSEPKATEKLEDAELLVNSRRRFSKRVEPGKAIGTDPPQGEEVECNSEVTLLISKGVDLVTLPDVVGLQEDAAEAELESEGFIVDIDERDSDEPAGQVISQSPGGGSELKRGATIKLTVSTGAGSVIMPDVEGQSESAARANLGSRGLSVIVQDRETTKPNEDDRVLDQAPAPGTRLRAGDRVTIVVGVLIEEEEPQPQPQPQPEAAPKAKEATNP